MTRLLLALALLIMARPAFSQFYPTRYRPPGLDWQQLETPHFKLLFPRGEDSVAFRAGRILEAEYPEIVSLVGGGLADFPVILNNYNDRSNGFVTPFNFRSEIEIPPIKGKSMNPQSGSWMATVAPHELVHAAHFSHLNGWWAGLLGFFSPDAARSLHSSIPLGIHEGIATHFETVAAGPAGGRGHYPYFYNRFNATFTGPGRWSLGQMLSVSTHTRPFDRHYLGGYEFTAWLQQTYGSDITRRAIDYFIRWPFLGYGFALHRVTGEWPARLFDRFEREKEKEMKMRGSHSARYESLDIPYRGRMLRRPLWLSDKKLLLYGSFYNARPGFYRYNLETSSFDRVLETRTVQDYRYDLSAGRTRILYSNYRPSALYDRSYKMELYEADLSTGQSRRLTHGLRGHAPVYRPENGRLMAIQTDHDSGALVRIAASGPENYRVTERIRLTGTDFKSVAPDPSHPDRLAIVAARGGMQGLWIVPSDSIAMRMKGAPDVSFLEGSVFDPAWHPSGNRILFTADQGGTMQVYEYDPGGDRVRRLTDSAFNAMEASYSPDGDRVAFIIQKGNEQLPALLRRNRMTGTPVPHGLWKPSREKRARMAQPVIEPEPEQDPDDWATSRYRPGLRRLKPRSFFPTVEEVSNSGTYKFGLGFYGNDLLQRNAYDLEVSAVQRLPWYDFTWRHSGFFPGFEFSSFSRPSFPVYQVETPSGPEPVQTFRLLRQDLATSLGVPVRLTLESNSRFSSAGITPSLKLRGTRFYELDHHGSPASGFASFVTGNLYTFFNYRLQQNIRDLQPNAGLALYSELEYFFTSGSTVVNTGRYSIPVDFIRPAAWRTGLFVFTSPLRRWNQSLRIGAEALTQTGRVFDNQSLVSEGFSEPVFPEARHMLDLSTRYTIPLFYPDNGGFLVPFYLSHIYLVGFTDTVSDLSHARTNELVAGSRTVLGLGLRARFRISNFSIELGAAVGYEPTRKAARFFIGNF